MAGSANLAKGPETKLREKVRARAVKMGVPAIRMHFGPGIKTGWPDEQFLIPGGRPLFLEAKDRGNEPTEKQYKRMQELWELGYDVGWYDDENAAIAAIARALDAAQLPSPRNRVFARSRLRCAVP
jgi:hypothetical protein